jgi:pimeloyl-ACP methyl ester carboxylesterase
MRTILQSGQMSDTERQPGVGKRGWRRWVRKIALVAVAVILALTSTLLLAGSVAKARLLATHPPLGMLVDVGGYRMHIACQGAGSPTVILEAGAGGFGLHWALVQPAVASQSRVCVYDRAGLGWSDPSPRPRTPAVMAEELGMLLERAQIRGPYVLVGHSLGGPIVRQFALAHPQDVVGMVLVDSSRERQVARFPEPVRASMGSQLLTMRLLNLAASSGLLALSPTLMPTPAQLPDETAATFRALVSSSGKAIRTYQAEITAAIEDTTAQAMSLGNIPLVVIRHDRSSLSVGGAVTATVVEQYEATWAQMQEELSALSSRGTVVIAEGSGHDIHLEQPSLVHIGVNI